MKSLTSKALVFYAILCLCLSVGFITLHLSTPSDGARLQRGNTLFTSQGAILSPYTKDNSLLKDGDILVAVQQISIKSRAEAFFTPVALPKDWKIGKSIEYTLIREGKEVKINVAQVQLPLRAILAENWGLILFILVSQGVSGFIFFQKRADPAAQAFFIWAFSGSHSYSWAFFLQASDLVGGVGFWAFRLAATGLWLVFWVAEIHMLLVFPRPLLTPKTVRKTLLLLYASPFVLFGSYVGAAFLLVPDILTWWNTWSNGEFIIAAIYTLPAVVLMFVQYTTARSYADKKKVRLLIYGALVSTFLGQVLYFLPGLFLNRTFLNPNGLGLVGFPFIFGIAIAIWRYHLFDIDVIIRKTMVYSILTTLLGLLYFGGVALLQNIVSTYGRATDASFPVSAYPSSIIIVLTTLAIAILFNPLRRRIQEFIDRRFYRQKYDAEKALAGFAEITRGQTDIDSLISGMTDLVQITLQPESTSLWIKKE